MDQSPLGKNIAVLKCRTVKYLHSFEMNQLRKIFFFIPRISKFPQLFLEQRWLCVNYCQCREGGARQSSLWTLNKTRLFHLLAAPVPPPPPVLPRWLCRTHHCRPAPNARDPLWGAGGGPGRAEGTLSLSLSLPSPVPARRGPAIGDRVRPLRGCRGRAFLPSHPRRLPAALPCAGPCRRCHPPRPERGAALARGQPSPPLPPPAGRSAERNPPASVLQVTGQSNSRQSRQQPAAACPAPNTWTRR